jgi:hypothetical protein
MVRNPFAQHLAPNAGVVRGGGEENNVPSQYFFRKNSGKELTEQNGNVFLEIFPLAGSGSLKFTLYD